MLEMLAGRRVGGSDQNSEFSVQIRIRNSEFRIRNSDQDSEF